MTIKGIELMCGIGGASRGFLDAGIKIVKGIDIDGSCKKTYEENNKPAQFVECDILKLTSKELLSGIELKNNDKLVFIACASCQPFSRAGIKDHGDSRTKLILAINDFIYDIMPEFVFVENVPGFQLFYPEIYEKFLRPYLELKYHFDYDMVNLKEYGVPQNRRRYLFIASKRFEISCPERTHGKEHLPHVTVRDAIAKYPPLKAGQEDGNVPNHVCYNASEITLKRLKYTPKDGGSRSAWPEHLKLECHKRSTGHSDVYGRMRWDEPGPTLTCRCINVSNGRFAHPEQDRGISVREALALQTFKDNFACYEPKSLAARHIGNAVPPLVAFRFAQRMIETVSRKEKSTRTERSKTTMSIDQRLGEPYTDVLCQLHQ